MAVCEVGCGRDSIFNHLDGFSEMTIIEPELYFLDLQPDIINKSKVYKVRNKLEKVSELFKDRFDLVIVAGLIHEVNEPTKFLGHIRKICSENGIVLITINNTHSIHRLIGNEMGELDNVNGLTTTAKFFNQFSGSFTMKNIIEMCKKVDLSIEHHETFMPKFLPHSKMQRLIDDKIIDIDFVNSLYKIGETGVLTNFGSEIILVVRK